MAGTHIYARAQGGETPQWLAEQVGKKTVWRALESVSSDYVGGGSRSVHYQSSDESVIRPEQFGSQIGVVKTKAGEFRGVRAFLVDGGDYVLRLHWPAVMLPKIAQAASPADWVRELVDTDATATAKPDPESESAQAQQEQQAAADADGADPLDALADALHQSQSTPEPPAGSSRPRFALREPGREEGCKE